MSGLSEKFLSDRGDERNSDPAKHENEAEGGMTQVLAIPYFDIVFTDD